MVKRRRIPPAPPDLRRRQDDDCSARQLGGRKGLICEGASSGGSNPSGGHCRVGGGLPRGQAETRAFDCAVVEWLNRNPVCFPRGSCFGCGGSKHTYDKLLPYGIEQTGHAWQHSRCWEDMACKSEGQGGRHPITDHGGLVMGKRSNFERREGFLRPNHDSPDGATSVPAGGLMLNERSASERAAGNTNRKGYSCPVVSVFSRDC